jgi:hypothetical protein
MLRTLDHNRSEMDRLDADNKNISEYLAENYEGVKRLRWRDALGRLRAFRVNPKSTTYQPGTPGLAWLKAHHPDIYARVTKTVLDTDAYARAREQGVITNAMHNAMLPRNDEGEPIPARTRRASIVIPAKEIEERNDASS